MKFLVVDGHAMTRDGLGATLAQLRPEALVLQARDLTEALALVAEHDDIEAVLLVVGAAGSGLDAIDAFRNARESLPVVVLSGAETARDARDALTRGAFGYVPRSASPRTLLSAVRLVLDGDRYVPPLVLNGLADSGKSEARGDKPPRPPALTDRQIEVLRRVCAGFSNKAIARELGVSEKTVKAHVTAILKALNVANRGQAATAGRAAGFV
ncbi:LuxR C-terminal-related transcriptional regulator [Roseiarcus fermentans]|uniref:LuxR C-terminal-related transcriptional regulator n=1 Tax=Roseiarcus fermentans TaxID=1473586 RepID=UPI000DE9DC4E|nr:response regulator transcription factor [Roseiarcus fermentans]